MSHYVTIWLHLAFWLTKYNERKKQEAQSNNENKKDKYINKKSKDIKIFVFTKLFLTDWHA